MGDLDASIVETQKVLSAVISKPKLTEALLKKPPFRFLHDIVTEVKKVSGFPESFTDHDLDSNNFKDKESKVAYLNKVISAVSEAVGEVKVKSSKIVAGMEPENTNALLQGLAKAASGGNAKAAPPPEEKKTAPPPPAEAPKQERPTPKPKASDEGGAEEGSAPDEARPGKSRGERTKKAPAAPTPEPEKAPEPEPVPIPKKAPPPAAQQHAEPSSQGGDDDSGVSRRMDRPRTARRAPPKVQSNVAHKDPRPGSKQSDSRTAAARVIVEGDDDAEDEDDDGGLSSVRPSANFGGNQGSAIVGAEGEHGMLVKNMMLKEQDIVSKDQKKDRGEDMAFAEGQKNKEREKTQEEINKLRDAIQSLCQSTNPLARSMDYIQEDVDNMEKELEFWQKDKVKQTHLLEEEEKKTEQELEKLVSQLQQVDESIKEEELRINDIKGSVLRNDMTIKQMLGSVVRNTASGR